MKLLIIHYHLKPGGVTSVIKSQLKILRSRLGEDNVTLLVGGNKEQNESVGHLRQIVSEPIDYLVEKVSSDKLQYRYNQILQTVMTMVTDDTIVYVHNLNLGKNPLLTYAIYTLANQGVKVINHCHDFAEDRPKNWLFLQEILSNLTDESLDKILYPNIPNYHFAALNSKDLKRLEGYGVDGRKIHFLPNPISFSIADLKRLGDVKDRKIDICRDLGIDPSKMVITYPVRVIRRKNIGEFILLAELFSDLANWLVTLSPKNPDEKVEYLQWKDFCNKSQIDILFDVGEDREFSEVLGITDRCITTSVMEGFGMVFLEPWLFSVPVVGRDLLNVSDDFKRAGIKFPYLYEKIDPGDEYSDRDDFSLLSFEDKVKVIESLRKDNLKREEFLKRNNGLFNLFTSVNKEIVQRNKRRIEEDYSLDKYGERLNGAFQSLCRPS